MRTPVAFLVGLRHPEGQKAQHAPGPLKSRQGLPLALEHREHGRMERVGGLERVSRLVHGEPTRDLLAVLQRPVGVLSRHLHAIVGHPHPLEQPAPDDLGGLGLRRHEDRLAEAVQELLEPFVIGVIFGRHLKLGGRYGYRKHHVVLGAGRLGQVLEEVVQLRGEAAAPIPAYVVHKLVHEDETRPVLGQEGAYHVARGGLPKPLVFGDLRQGLLAAELERDLAQWGLPYRRTIVSATAREGVELGTHEHGRSGMRDFPDLRFFQ